MKKNHPDKCSAYLCVFQVTYESHQREVSRLLKDHTERLQRGQVLTDAGFDRDLHQTVTGRAGLLLDRMAGKVEQECERVGAWALIGQGLGAPLVKPGTREPMSRDELMGKFIASHWCLLDKCE